MTISTARSPWLHYEAAALIILGLLALLFPLLTGVVVAIFAGWLLMISGVIGLISAFSSKDHTHFGFSIASAVIALLAGLLIALHPVLGAVSITLVVAGYLLFDGVTMIGFAMDQKKRGEMRWRWPIAVGVADILLAVVLITLFGASDAVVIGIVVAIDLIAAGIGMWGLAGREPVQHGTVV